jgi:hypothetical protein
MGLERSAKLNKTVQRTVLSDKRRELDRAAGRKHRLTKTQTYVTKPSGCGCGLMGWPRFAKRSSGPFCAANARSASGRPGENFGSRWCKRSQGARAVLWVGSGSAKLNKTDEQIVLSGQRAEPERGPGRKTPAYENTGLCYKAQRARV